METHTNHNEPPGETPQQRAERAEKTRKRQAARLAAGLCVRCGKSAAAEGKQRCGNCLTQALNRSKSDRDKAKEHREAQHAEALTASITVPCPFCGKKSLDLVFVRFGEPRVVCDDCKREFRRPTQPPSPPCPYCGERCVHAGRRRDGKRKYQCVACRKRNTSGWPADTPSPGGPFPHLISICLGPLSHTNLMRYCQAHKMSQVQAIRHIFRAVLDEPLHKMSFARRSYHTDGSYHMSIKSATAANDPRYDPNQRFPDIRAEEMARRLSQGNIFHRTAGVSSTVTVMLDDRAKEGLMKATEMFHLDHQRAARLLIERAV